MPDVNEPLPAYLRGSQPAPAPPASVQQPVTPMPAQPAQQEQLPAYLQNQGTQPQQQSSGVDSEGFAPITDAQIKALTKPAATAQSEEYVPAYLKADSAGGQESEQSDPNLLHKLFGKTAGDYVGYGLDIAPFFIPVFGEVAGATGLAIRGGTAIGDYLAERGLLKGVNTAIEKTLASHWGRGTVEGGAFGLYDSGNRYLQGHEFTPVTSTLEGAAAGGVIGAGIGGVSKFLGRAEEALGPKTVSRKGPEQEHETNIVKDRDVNYDRLAEQARDISKGRPGTEVPIYTTDVLPPTSVTYRYMRKLADHGPFGTGSLRVKQQQARKNLSDAVKTEFGARGYDNQDLLEQVVNSHKNFIDNTTKQLDEYSKLMQGKRIFQDDSVRAINNELQSTNDPILTKKLHDVAESLRNDPSFENMQALRADMKDIPVIKKAFTDDLDTSVFNAVPEKSYNRWKVTNNKLDEHIDSINRTAIKNILNNENVSPNVVSQILTGASEKDIAALKPLLTDEGREMAVSGIVDDAISRSLDADGKINPTLLSENLTNREGHINSIADGEDQRFLHGVANILRHTERAQEAEHGETVSKIISWAQIPAMLLHPIAGVPGIGSSLLLNLYERPIARTIIKKMATNIGPEKMNRYLAKLGKMMGLDGKTGEALQAETFGSRTSMTKPNFATHTADPNVNAAGWAGDAGAPTNNPVVHNVQPGMTPGQMAGAGLAGAGLAATTGGMLTPFTDQQTVMPTAPISQGIQAQPYQTQMQQLPPMQELPNVQPQQVNQQPPAIAPAAMTRGLRNNNPLNIRSTGVHGNQWRGKVADAGGFVRFDTVEHGIRASVKVLKTYRRKGLTTITGIINRFAPAGDGNNLSLIHISEPTRPY